MSVHTLITDSMVSEDHVRGFKKRGVEVIVAD